MRKIILIFLFCILYYSSSFSQDSLLTNSYSIGVTSSIIDNCSSIGGGVRGEKFTSAEHKAGWGYTEGLCFLYQYRNLLFEFAVQYSQENDRFTNIPSIHSREVVVDTTFTYVERYLDYMNTVNVSLRTSSIAFLFKVNVVAIETKKLSAGFGLGIAPFFITSETVYDWQTHEFVKQFYGNHDGGSHIKAVGSLNLIYSFSKKWQLKISPTASYYMTTRSAAGYSIRPFNAGLELGLFYKLK